MGAGRTALAWRQASFRLEYSRSLAYNGVRRRWQRSAWSISVSSRPSIEGGFGGSGGLPGQGQDERAAAPAVVQRLLGLRRRIGALFGWDHQRPAWNAESYANRLSPADRAQSLVAPGTPDGNFRLLYRFDDEQLSELRNATVHAFVSLSIRPMPSGYLAYAGVFVQPVHRFTRLYMGAIAPFRRLVVYPAVLRTVQSAWAQRYGGESAA